MSVCDWKLWAGVFVLMASWQICLLEFPFQESESHMWIKKPVAHNLLWIAQTNNEKKILFCLLWFLLLGVCTFRRGRYYQNDNNVIETETLHSSRWVFRGESCRLLLSNTEQKFTSFSQQCAQRQALLNLSGLMWNMKLWMNPCQSVSLMPECCNVLFQICTCGTVTVFSPTRGGLGMVNNALYGSAHHTDLRFIGWNGLQSSD